MPFNFKASQARRDHYATRGQKEILRQLQSSRHRHEPQQSKSAPSSKSHPVRSTSYPVSASLGNESGSSEEEEQPMTMSQTTYSDEDMHTDDLSEDDLSEDDLSEDDPSPDDLSHDGRSSSTQIYVGTYIFPKFYRNLLFQKLSRYFTVIFL